jgi:hypothetical protein
MTAAPRTRRRHISVTDDRLEEGALYSCRDYFTVVNFTAASCRTNFSVEIKFAAHGGYFLKYSDVTGCDVTSQLSTMCREGRLYTRMPNELLTSIRQCVDL